MRFEIRKTDRSATHICGGFPQSPIWKDGSRPRGFECIYRSLGVVSDKIASAKRNPVQTGNPPPSTTTTTTTTNDNNGRCEGESQGKTRVLGSFLTIYMETNRDKRCWRERHGRSESLGSAVSGVRCPVSGVRGPRSMAPCVARERCRCKNTK